MDDRARLRRARILLVVAPAAVLAVLVVTALAAPGVFWPTVDGDDLGASVGRELDVAVPRGCDPAGPGRWVCAVARDELSGISAVYRVRIDDRCWIARRSEGDAAPEGASACVSALDHLLP